MVVQDENWIHKSQRDLSSGDHEPHQVSCESVKQLLKYFSLHQSGGQATTQTERLCYQ